MKARIKTHTNKILVIDDDPTIIRSIISILNEESEVDYTFYHATNGNEGFKVAQKYLPNIIITDWEMPGISGIETIERLKKTTVTQNIPVIMLTGKMIGSKNLKIALKTGAIDFICKPIDRIELTARVQSILTLASYHNDIVMLKNQELSSTAIHLIQSNEERINLIKSIEGIDSVYGVKDRELSAELKTIYRQMSSSISNDSWTQFEQYFNKTHPSFIQDLLLKYENLSPADLRMAVLTRMKLSSKGIAAILYISEDSVKTQRSRLRKKLNIDRSENLTVFLRQF